MSKPYDGPAFVWIAGLRGPEGQKWDTLFNGYKRDYLAAYPLTESEWSWPIDALAAKFPAPKVAA